MRLVHQSQLIDSPRVLQALRRAKSKLQIRRAVKIYQSRRIKTPMIWCWCSRPILLIPKPSNQSDKKIDWVSVFCHELAHWKRYDHWCSLVAEMSVCIFWPNPLVWWARQRLIRLSEQACDDWVVAAGQSKTDYADSLLNLVPQGRMTLVPTVMGGKKEMKNRIKRIIQDRGENPRISSRWTLLFGFLTLGLALGLALTQTRAAERDQERERDRITREEGKERIVHPEEREREERDVRFREWSRELEKLKDAERNTERRLKGLRDGQDEEARELQAQLRRIQREMTDVKRALYESTRERQGDREREHAERAVHRQALAREMRELHERAGDLEHAMKDLGDRHPERRRELQNELCEIHEHMQNLEREMKGFDRERAELREGQVYERELHQKELMIHRKNLQERLEHLERELKETDNEEKAHQLKREREQTAAEIRQVERQARELMQQHLHERPDEPRPPREPGMPHFESRPDLERQLHELRSQVDEMRQEIKEIRSLLLQFLTQNRER